MNVDVVHASAVYNFHQVAPARIVGADRAALRAISQLNSALIYFKIRIKYLITFLSIA